jgi:uncharacterized membrane protein
MSILLGFLSVPILFFLPVTIPVWIGIIVQIPMVVDGVTQKLGWRESNNFLRIITGSLSGLGLSIGTVWGSRWIVEIIGRGDSDVIFSAVCFGVSRDLSGFFFL